jgi:hypothetical protein
MEQIRKQVTMTSAGFALTFTSTAKSTFHPSVSIALQQSHVLHVRQSIMCLTPLRIKPVTPETKKPDNFTKLKRKAISANKKT